MATATKPIRRGTDGRQRWVYPKQCEVCKKTYYVPKHWTNSHCCSKKCRLERLSRLRRVWLKCAQCGGEFDRPKGHLKSKSGLFFCTRKCKDIAQRIDGISGIHPPHYQNGSFAYRDMGFRVYGKKCSQCGYATNETMLDVHHKDGDREHNVVENLEVLCVWCHIMRTRRIEPHPWNGNLGQEHERQCITPAR